MIIECNKPVHKNTPIESLLLGEMVRIFSPKGLISLSFRETTLGGITLGLVPGHGPATYEILSGFKTLSDGMIPSDIDEVIILFPETLCDNLHFFWGSTHRGKSIYLTNLELKEMEDLNVLS